MMVTDELLVIERLTKRFGRITAVQGLSLTVRQGEIITLLGPSGCGKTTTLRMLAGFVEPDGGEIRLSGKVISSSRWAIPPEMRKMGMVFQDYAIWPHMTVFKNVAFSLRVKRLSISEVQKRVEQALQLVELSGYGGRYASELSGGQQQRVALARAIVAEPTILLLDEPLSNLDAKLREQMRLEVKSLQKRLGITFVYVTHDQIEALAISDRIVLMNGGAVEQIGTPAEIYFKPKSVFAASFVGLANFFEGVVVDGPLQDRDYINFRTQSGDLIKARFNSRPSVGDKRRLFVRPEGIQLNEARPIETQNTIRGRIENRVMLGNLVQFHISCDVYNLIAQVSPYSCEAQLQVGLFVHAHLRPESCLLMPVQ